MKPLAIGVLGLSLVAIVGGACVSRTTTVVSETQQDLVGKKLHWQFFKMRAEREGIDHEHCTFCQTPLMEEPKKSSKVQTDGYTTDDLTVWVCNACFERHNPQYKWITQ